MDPPLYPEVMALVAASRFCANCKCHVRGPLWAMGWRRALLSELFVTCPQEFEDYPVGEYDCDLLVWNGEVWLRSASRESGARAKEACSIDGSPAQCPRSNIISNRKGSRPSRPAFEAQQEFNVYVARHRLVHLSACRL
jgi:hypothetical protein